MARSLLNFLHNLLKTVTTYYTATYSSDTDLYQILKMYGAELASGSTALETVRNNAYVILCENAKLYDNFGTYFSQLKTADQDYNEDLYVSGSALYTVGPTAVQINMKINPEYKYFYTGDKKTFITNEFASIPSYRKQLDFLLESVMNGGTRLGIVRAVDAFTLINPDIRELYKHRGWKLKSVAGQVIQISSNTWQFTNVPLWRDDLWQGSHTTFTSGSTVTDKIVAGYIVLVNIDNTITVGSIYNDNLLFNLRRP